MFPLYLASWCGSNELDSNQSSAYNNVNFPDSIFIDY